MSSKEMNNIEEQVKAIYDVMQEEKVEEIDIKSDDIKLYIRRKSPKIQSKQAINSVPEQLQQVLEPSAAASASEISGSTVKSPITGVFYRAPSPASPMFVKEGDIVDNGKTICIIEAMKVMNEIKADCKMKIIKILVENGKSVTAEQDLFSVEKL